MRLAVSLALLAACRLHFDALATDDAASDDAAGDVAPAPDAMVTPLVQAIQFDATSGGFTINAINGGLAPVTTGNMVLVVCGHPNATGQCLPSSTPDFAWNQIDGGTSLGVYVACGAPAFTSITVQNGAGHVNVLVTEWTGVVGTNCLDRSRISSPCPAPPGTWTSQATNPVTQNRELIIAVGMASAVDAGYTIDPPYVMARNATGINSAATVYTAYQTVDAAPTTYSATGTIAQSQGGQACFNDIFTFKRCDHLRQPTVTTSQGAKV